ncbi:MAG: hydroxymethylpyrimidine/phosphomethylpyrimidine kinase [Thermoanaerobaculia bacterium]
MTRPFLLSVAGLDPSGGAGLFADIGTFEAFDVHGLGVCSALTRQHDAEFRGLDWIDGPRMLAQLEPLVERYEVAAMKIGAIESIESLLMVIRAARNRGHNPSIVWDPVFAPSAGGTFRDPWLPGEFMEACGKVTLVTPNRPEMMAIFPSLTPEIAAARLSERCAVLLKGGHAEGEIVRDLLYVHGKVELELTGPRLGHDKRGTGCITSAAIASRLAQGATVGTACRDAVRYVRGYILTAPGPFGIHLSWGLVSIGMS